MPAADPRPEEPPIEGPGAWQCEDRYRHPYVFEALCIRAEGIRINFVPKVFGDPMYSMWLLQHGRLFEVGLRIIGVTQELHVLVSFSVATCDSALTDCDFRRNFRS